MPIYIYIYIYDIDVAVLQADNKTRPQKEMMLDPCALLILLYLNDSYLRIHGIDDAARTIRVLPHVRFVLPVPERAVLQVEVSLVKVATIASVVQPVSRTL